MKSQPSQIEDQSPDPAEAVRAARETRMLSVASQGPAVIAQGWLIVGFVLLLVIEESVSRTIYTICLFFLIACMILSPLIKDLWMQLRRKRMFVSKADAEHNERNRNPERIIGKYILCILALCIAGVYVPLEYIVSGNIAVVSTRILISILFIIVSAWFLLRYRRLRLWEDVLMMVGSLGNISIVWLVDPTVFKGFTMMFFLPLAVSQIVAGASFHRRYRKWEETRLIMEVQE